MARKDSRRVVRVFLDKHLRVVIGSIGAEVRYNLTTRNISINGFFLDFEKPGRFPFTPASILEVWIELEEGKTIFFNGKVARVVRPGDPTAHVTGPGIAIRIVQIDKEGENILREYLNRKMLDNPTNNGDIAS